MREIELENFELYHIFMRNEFDVNPTVINSVIALIERAGNLKFKNDFCTSTSLKRIIEELLRLQSTYISFDKEEHDIFSKSKEIIRFPLESSDIFENLFDYIDFKTLEYRNRLEVLSKENANLKEENQTLKNEVESLKGQFQRKQAEVDFFQKNSFNQSNLPSTKKATLPIVSRLNLQSNDNQIKESIAQQNHKLINNNQNIPLFLTCGHHHGNHFQNNFQNIFQVACVGQEMSKNVQTFVSIPPQQQNFKCNHQKPEPDKAASQLNPSQAQRINGLNSKPIKKTIRNILAKPAECDMKTVNHSETAKSDQSIKGYLIIKNHILRESTEINDQQTPRFIQNDNSTCISNFKRKISNGSIQNNKKTCLSYDKQTEIEIKLESNEKENKNLQILDIESKIRYAAEIYFKQKYRKTSPNFKHTKLHIRFHADSKNIAPHPKVRHLLSFQILNDEPNSSITNENNLLGIYEGYKSFGVCFTELVDNLVKLKTIEIESQKLELIFYFSGDLKILAQSLGIKNSKYPCVWCKCWENNFADSELSMLYASNAARSNDELMEVVQLPNESKSIRYGYDKLPLFKDTIPFKRHIMDMHYLFVHISHSLINLLIKDCELIDKFDGWALTTFDVNEFRHLHAFQAFLSQRCEVDFKFLWLSEKKKLTWRNLESDEIIRIIQNISIKEIIPERDNFDLLDTIWKEFYGIFKDIKRVQLTHDEVKSRTKEWLSIFLRIYSKTTVTTYIHIFVTHLHEFVYLYKDLNALNFNCLEKLY